MTIIGMDIHRSFAQAAFPQDGQNKREQRVDLMHARLVKFTKTLSDDDESSAMLSSPRSPSSTTRIAR